MNSSKGQELLIDFYGVNNTLLKNSYKLNKIFKIALKKTGFHILKNISHQFKKGGKGVTGIFLLAESHASYHTYPEWCYISIDIYSCGKQNPKTALNIIKRSLSPKYIKIKYLRRLFKK